jgi:hypothetical protein
VLLDRYVVLFSRAGVAHRLIIFPVACSEGYVPDKLELLVKLRLLDLTGNHVEGATTTSITLEPRSA